MTDSHDVTHEQLLAEILAGELELTDAAAAPVLGCGQCRAELEEMTATTTLLDEAGREQRELLADTVDPLAARPTTTVDGTRRRPWLLLAAAVLAIAATVVTMRRFDEPARGGVLDGSMLLHGQVDVEDFEPAGMVAEESLFPFRWRAAGELLDPTYRMEVREIDAGGRLSPTPIIERTQLRAARWLPDEQERARILACAAIQWQVIAEDMATPGEIRLPAIVVGWR